jgi:CHAT domain-containing protein
MLLMALQPEIINAQPTAPLDAPDPANTTAEIVFDPETSLPFLSLGQIAANTPPAIRAMTLPEQTAYEGRVAQFHGAISRRDWAQALAAGNDVLALEELSFGPEHPNTLGTLIDIFTSLQALGRDRDAEPVAARIVQVAEASLGKHHPQTIASLGDHAAVLNRLSRPVEGAPLLAEALARNRRIHGGRHPATLRSISDYASSLVTIGRAADAEPLFLEALQRHREVFGPRHPDTLASLNNYAFLISKRGRTAEATQLFAEALQLRRETLGERHQATLGSLNNYALALAAAGRIAEAEPIAAQAFQLHREVLGQRHPDTLTNQTNHAVVLEKLGRAEEARQLLAEALRLRQEVLGERHPDTLGSLNAYAGVLETLGRASEAEPIYARALQLYREVRGDQHPDTLSCLNNYALVLEALGRAEEAELLFAEGWRLTKQLLGERHPETLATLNNHAFSLKALGRLSEAESLFAEALRLRRDTLGNRHPDALSSLNNYALVLEALGRATEAEPLFAETLRLRREVLGEQHPDTLGSINNYAGVLETLGRHEEAEPLFADALQRRRDVLGDRHPKTIITAQNLARTRLKLTARDTDALAPARLAVAALRSRFAETGAAGVRGEAQQKRDRADLQSTELLFADAAWQRASNHPDEAAALHGEIFAALQTVGAGAASRAIALTAARRYAESAGVGELVAERTRLVEVWAAAERKSIAAQAQIEGQDMAARAAMDRAMQDIEARIRAIDAQLQAKAPQYSAIVNQPPLDIVAAQALLGASEAVLIVVPSAFGTQIMALTNSQLVWQHSAVNEAGIAKMVARLRRDLNPSEAQSPDEFLRFDRATAHELYIALITPVAALLAGKDTVFIAADGALASLPFGVLITEAPKPGSSDDDLDIMRTAPWFADAHALVQIPSIQSLAYLRTFNLRSKSPAKARVGKAFAGYGDPLLVGTSMSRGARGANVPVFDAKTLAGQVLTTAGTLLMDPVELRKLASLPGTARELGAVQKMLGAPNGAIRLLADMTEDRLRTADLSKVRILHLATHGLTSSESGAMAEPGLVFTPPATASSANDGYLAASEVLELDLRATEWVILSACNTAAPSGKPGDSGLSGLARAFFYAGAASLLVSHWPVYDSVAAELTVNALRRTQNGETRAKALQAAMRDIRNTIDQPEFAHPGAWAAFILAGEGR